MKSHSAADARPNQLQKRVLPALFHLRCPSQSHQRSARGRTRLTISAVVRCSDSDCIFFTTRLMLRLCTDGCKGVLEQVRGSEQHDITEAAPNKLQLGEGGRSGKRWPSARRWHRGVFVRHRLRSKHYRFGVFRL